MFQDAILLFKIFKKSTTILAKTLVITKRVLFLFAKWAKPVPTTASVGLINSLSAALDNLALALDGLDIALDCLIQSLNKKMSNIKNSIDKKMEN